MATLDVAPPPAPRVKPPTAALNHKGGRHITTKTLLLEAMEAISFVSKAPQQLLKFTFGQAGRAASKGVAASEKRVGQRVDDLRERNPDVRSVFKVDGGPAPTKEQTAEPKEQEPQKAAKNASHNGKDLSVMGRVGSAWTETMVALGRAAMTVYFAIPGAKAIAPVTYAEFEEEKAARSQAAADKRADVAPEQGSKSQTQEQAAEQQAEPVVAPQQTQEVAVREMPLRLKVLEANVKSTYGHVGAMAESIDARDLHQYAMQSLDLMEDAYTKKTGGKVPGADTIEVILGAKPDAFRQLLTSQERQWTTAQLDTAAALVLHASRLQHTGRGSDGVILDNTLTATAVAARHAFVEAGGRPTRTQEKIDSFVANGGVEQEADLDGLKAASFMIRDQAPNRTALVQEAHAANTVAREATINQTAAREAAAQEATVQL